MEKRNTLLLTVIAVATLLVAVVGATFAYFATNTSEATGNVGVTANTAAGGNSSFTAVGDTLTLNITAAMMQQSAVNETDAKDTQTANLNVSYLSGSENQTSCSYNVKYKWVKDSGVYTKVATGTQKEFTYSVTGTATAVPETNFVATDSTASADGTGVLLASETITNGSTSQATNKQYTITAKFYNIDANQSVNADKSFKLQFYVDNIVC